MRKITKLFSNQTIKSIDEDKRQASYIISTDDVDRMGEVVEQSWDLKNYEANPIVLFGHDPSKPENVLGKALAITTEKDGDRSVTSAVNHSFPSTTPDCFQADTSALFWAMALSV